jgi:hypothetical protein
MKKLIVIAAMVMVLGIVTMAQAVPVTYTFSGTSYDGVASFSCAYTAPDFITSATMLYPYQLDSWSTSGAADLLQVFFVPKDNNNWDSIWFNVYPTVHLFYFGLDSFSTPGTYTAVGGNPGTLTVSTPEPSLMILLGIAVMSLVGLRRWWKE